MGHCEGKRFFLTEFGVNCILADNWIYRRASAMLEVTGHRLMESWATGPSRVHAELSRIDGVR